MKIAFIGQKGIPAKIGGVETHVEQLAKRLAARGHEVFAYVRNNYTGRGVREYEGVKLIRLPGIGTKHLDAISHTFLATIHALFQGYDIIHYQAIGPSLLSWLPRLFLRRTKVVATFHCQDYYHKKWGAAARLALRIGEYAACTFPHQTIVVSKILRDYVKNSYNKNANYIPSGVSVNFPRGEEELESRGLKKREYAIIVSRFVRHKGIHYAIEAFKNLEDRGLTREYKLVIIGESFHTSEYAEFLRKHSGARPSIIFTGALSGEPLAQLFANAGVFIFPSESEGLSITLLEATAYGLPIILSDIAENREALFEFGKYFSSGDVRDLEDKMTDFFQNPEQMVQLGAKARQHVRQNFDWDAIAQKTENLYYDILKSGQK